MSVSVAGGSLSKIMSVPDAGSGSSAGGVIAGGTGVGVGDGVTTIVGREVAITSTASELFGIALLGAVSLEGSLGEMLERKMKIAIITASTITVVTMVRTSCPLFFASEELLMFCKTF